MNRFRLLTLIAILPACAPLRMSPPPAPSDRGSSAIDTAAAAMPLADPVTTAEVAREAVEVFGDTTTVATALDVTDSADVEITWDIDVRSYETRDRVAFWVNVFTGDAKSRMEERLERGSRYEPMIRSRLREAGLPEDMYYLALIESGYNPHAYSRAAAVGMWQFMTSTAKGTGMRVDWWVDERRDPVRSTEGAMKFLSYLKDQFGSLFLAAAAYNGGPGRIARGLRRYEDDLDGTTGDDVFFALAEVSNLPSETKDYVPKLIAAALVGKDPSRYGLKVTPREPFVYDSVLVPEMTPLSAVATAAGVTIPAIVELNSFLLRGVTPPNTSTWVRIPPESRASFDSIFASLDKDALTPWLRVKATKGQTIRSLARAHGLGEKHIVWYNPTSAKRGGKLYAGEPMLVPRKLTVAAALDVPDPAIERYGTGTRVHVVKRGETLSHIAVRYRTTVRDIMRRNRLKKPTIFPGQSLVVSGTRPSSR